MGWTPDLEWLEHVLADAADRAGQTVEECARGNKLDLVLSSARLAAACPIDDTTRRQLESAVSLNLRYRQLFRLLQGVDPQAYVQKGFAIGDRYPKGWLRAAADLDVVLSSPSLIWTCVQALHAEGLNVTRIVLLQSEGKLYPSVQMIRLPEVVELLSIPFWGNVWTIPPIAQFYGCGMPPDDVVQLVALAEERLQRPFRLRDCLDAGLLCRSITTMPFQALAGTLDLVGMAPEFVELTQAAATLGIPPASELIVVHQASLRQMVRRARAARPRRLARILATSSGRAAWIADRLSVARTPGRLGAALTIRAQQRHRAIQVLNAGLPLAGIPVDDRPAAVEDLVFAETNFGGLVGRTPMGSFLLYYGRVIEDEWIADAKATVS